MKYNFTYLTNEQVTSQLTDVATHLVDILNSIRPLQEDAYRLAEMESALLEESSKRGVAVQQQAQSLV